MLPPKHVLLIEDDPDFSRALERAFRARHFEVASARNVQDALDRAGVRPPDCVVLDLNLDNESGLLLIKPLLRLNPAAKILVLTGYGSTATAVDSIKAGACHYLVKPVYMEEVIAGLGIDSGEDSPGIAKANGSERRHSLEEIEWEHILKALRASHGNVSAAARMLRMHLRTLQRKIASRKNTDPDFSLEDLRREAANEAEKRCRPATRAIDDVSDACGQSGNGTLESLSNRGAWLRT